MFRRLACCALALAAVSRSSALNLRSEASATWAENIGRSAAASDWRDAMRYDARTSLSLFREWRTGLVTTGEAGLALEHVPDFRRLDALTAGFAGSVRQKFGFGAYAPAVTAEVSLRHRAARLAEDDGWTAGASLQVGKRLTSAWRVAAVADWQQHDARSAIFETRHHRFFGTLTYDVTPWLQLSHGSGRLWGDFTANASGDVWARALTGGLGPDVQSYYRGVPQGVTGLLGPRWVSYRIHGRVSFWWLQLSPALGRNTSLPIRYDSLFSVNRVGIKYRQDLWTVQVLHRF